MLKSFYLIELPIDQLKTEEFKDKYGTIIEDVKIEPKPLFFYPLYLLRRFAYALGLIILYEHPVIQLIVMIIVTILPVSFL